MSNRREINFWKPRQNGEGSAALFNFNPDQSDRRNAYVSMLPQRDKGFNNDSRLTFQIGLVDASSLLAVLTNRLEGVGKQGDSGYMGLFHKSNNEGDNSILRFERYEGKNNNNGYALGLSVTRNGQTNRLSLVVYDNEVEALRIWLEDAIRYMTTSSYNGKTSEESEPVVDDSDIDNSEIPF